VKYMLLIYGNPSSQEAVAAGIDEVTAEVDGLMEELSESGELIGGQALADTATAKTVRVRDGVPTVTDGPFQETEEYLAGYLIVDCDSVERAAGIAARWPDARLCAMEVRPIVDEAV
jgi:hypothetical protein